MKRFLSLVVALVISFGIITGCDQDFMDGLQKTIDEIPKPGETRKPDETEAPAPIEHTLSEKEITKKLNKDIRDVLGSQIIEIKYNRNKNKLEIAYVVKNDWDYSGAQGNMEDDMDSVMDKIAVYIDVDTEFIIYGYFNEPKNKWKKKIKYLWPITSVKAAYDPDASWITWSDSDYKQTWISKEYEEELETHYRSWGIGSEN